MIVKFFPHGNTSQGKSGRTSGGNAVRNYLLGKDNGREKSTLIRGNPDQTTEIINGIRIKVFIQVAFYHSQKVRNPPKKN